MDYYNKNYYNKYDDDHFRKRYSFLKYSCFSCGNPGDFLLENQKTICTLCFNNDQNKLSEMCTKAQNDNKLKDAKIQQLEAQLESCEKEHNDNKIKDAKIQQMEAQLEQCDTSKDVTIQELNEGIKMRDIKIDLLQKHVASLESILTSINTSTSNVNYDDSNQNE